MVHCRICGNCIKKYQKINKINLYSCDNCLLKFYLPMPTKEELRKRYSDKELTKRFRGNIENAVLSNHRINKREFSIYFDFLSEAREKHKGGRVLDVGCYSGLFLTFFDKEGFICTGTDVNSGLVNWAKKTFGLDYRCGELASFNFEKNYFNIITCNQVLEHVSDPLALFSEMLDLLVVGGYLECSVPDSTCNCKMVYPEHLFHFYEKTVREMLSSFTNVEFVQSDISRGNMLFLVRKIR